MKPRNEKKKRIPKPGYHRTPAELEQQAKATMTNLICCYGRRQALIIANMIYNNLKKIQDEPTEIEKEQKAERVAKLSDKMKKLKEKLQAIEGD